MSQDIVCQKLRVMFSGTNLNYFLNLEKEKAEPGRSIIPRFIEINKFQQYRSLSLFVINDANFFPILVMPFKFISHD